MPATHHRRGHRNWVNIARRIVQAAFVAFILSATVRHNLAESAANASIDALCPFGAVETLWRVVAEGEYIPKTHPSNLVLGFGLLLGTILGGAAFCGWICPFGALQDALTWLRAKLSLPELRIPDRADRWLRFGRFLTLTLILYMTIGFVKLWFADYDPYRTIFGLGWIFEFDLSVHWPAYAIALTILVLSFFIPRFWCKYACPLGGVLSALQHLSLLRIRRRAESCRGCALCETPCPVSIDVASANPAVSVNCIGCLACVEACPRHGTLEVQLAPTWFDSLRNLYRRLRRPATIRP